MARIRLRGKTKRPLLSPGRKYCLLWQTGIEVKRQAPYRRSPHLRYTPPMPAAVTQQTMRLSSATDLPVVVVYAKHTLVYFSIFIFFRFYFVSASSISFKHRPSAAFQARGPLTLYARRRTQQQRRSSKKEYFLLLPSSLLFLISGGLHVV